MVELLLICAGKAQGRAGCRCREARRRPALIDRMRKWSTGARKALDYNGFLAVAASGATRPAQGSKIDFGRIRRFRRRPERERAPRRSQHRPFTAVEPATRS
jgi:hypothetical protein